MDYLVVLDPELDLTPNDFVLAWNEAPASGAVADAHLTEVKGAPSVDPYLIAGATVAVLGSVASDIAQDTLFDLIKRTLAKLEIHRSIEITPTVLPDGGPVFLVKAAA
ncbi:MAG: hypothetical protein HY326_01170, partial [Chloroflexi bacterium]|nr:hypothetical protein [Chloroflexota bacterium]